jgi:hypothetical protein
MDYLRGDAQPFGVGRSSSIVSGGRSIFIDDSCSFISNVRPYRHKLFDPGAGGGRISPGTTIDRVVVGHLRMSLGAAMALRAAIESRWCFAFWPLIARSRNLGIGPASGSNPKANLPIPRHSPWETGAS